MPASWLLWFCLCVDCSDVQCSRRVGAARFLSLVNGRRDQGVPLWDFQLGDPEMVVVPCTEASDVVKGKPEARKANSPWTFSWPNTHQDWLCCLAPSFPGGPPQLPAPAQSRRQHHNGLFLILTGSLLFFPPLQGFLGCNFSLRVIHHRHNVACAN